ncbi:hypothetical protein [Helicobacter sp.]|uniref:hypothetical protein n=1 Tax=Helicobacter sp. TaxID=218 RepID=UPI0025C710B5|nr:hypothetical protein [Helicobacter sp.]MCI5632712.1 hypothetical protein [Helicobacter sp.]
MKKSVVSLAVALLFASDLSHCGDILSNRISCYDTMHHSKEAQTYQNICANLIESSALLFLCVAKEPLTPKDKVSLQKLLIGVQNTEKTAKKRNDKEVYFTMLALENVLTISLDDKLLKLMGKNFKNIDCETFDIVEYGKEVEEANKDLAWA